MRRKESLFQPSNATSNVRKYLTIESHVPIDRESFLLIIQYRSRDNDNTPVISFSLRQDAGTHLKKSRVVLSASPKVSSQGITTFA